MADFLSVRLRFDPENGEARIEDRVHVPGMRVVWEQERGHGRVFVVRKPPHSYGGLASRSYSPAEFEVFEEAYTDTDRQCGIPEDDAPWIRVRPVVRFPVTIGTKRG